MTHRCPIASCTLVVPHYMFMCARHWRMVPRPLQAAVYAAYKRDGRAGDNHREALRVVNAAEAGRTALGLPIGTKAFTIWQPWASLVILRAKPHEFRRWKFTDKPHLAPLVGQRIVIHAGARPVRVGELTDLLDRIDEGESALDVAIARPFISAVLEARRRNEVGPAPLSAALGTAIIGEPRSVLDLFSHADSDRLDQHMYGWPLSDVRAFDTPIPAAGAQGFWSWS
jgi:hypothetical protein